MNPDDLDPAHRNLVVSSLQPGERLDVYGAIANNPSVLEGLRGFFGSLWNDSGLTDRQREIVILTAASKARSAYEWHQHVKIGLNSGLERDEIVAFGRDDRTPFSIGEQALIAHTRAVARGRVEDPLHEAVAEHFDDATIVGAATTAVSYLALGNIIDALGVEIEADDEFVGWNPAHPTEG